VGGFVCFWEIVAFNWDMLNFGMICDSQVF
jgi:hypothetical protein